MWLSAKRRTHATHCVNVQNSAGQTKGLEHGSDGKLGQEGGADAAAEAGGRADDHRRPFLHPLYGELGQVFTDILDGGKVKVTGDSTILLVEEFHRLSGNVRHACKEQELVTVTLKSSQIVNNGVQSKDLTDTLN